MQQRHISYNDIHQQVKLLSFRITASCWQPQVIVGVARGGLLPASLLSQNWQLPMRSLHVSLRDSVMFEPEQAHWLQDMLSSHKTVLVVDDINDSGATINLIKTDWQLQHQQSQSQISFSDQIRFATLLTKSSSSAAVDYAAVDLAQNEQKIWWVFPWETL